jgi:hypothetical protein
MVNRSNLVFNFQRLKTYLDATRHAHFYGTLGEDILARAWKLRDDEYAVYVERLLLMTRK